MHIKKKSKEIIVRIYNRGCKTCWDESFILHHYIRILFFVNVYIVFLSLFSGLLPWKIVGLMVLIMLFISKDFIIKYGRKYKEELEETP